jgi:hypothetical protein
MKVPAHQSVLWHQEKQSARQIEASGGRPIVWVFAEKEAAPAVQKLFDDADHGREKITVMHIPWVRVNP